jgi:hypothetical protein
MWQNHNAHGEKELCHLTATHRSVIVGIVAKGLIMTPEETLREVQESAESASQEKQERGRSTIVFPYQPLDDAIQVAKAVYNAGGPRCKVDQLAAQLKLATNASMFRLRLNTARIFGLITHAQGIVTLTDLGTRICDPQQESAAKVDSFLTVPLYAKIYEEFKGKNLPPMSGLEAAIGDMGVATKQKGNARQVFQRAATQAGFFAFGTDRLVYPTIKGGAPGNGGDAQRPPAEPEKPAAEKPKGDSNGGEGVSGIVLHPLIEGLIKTLPDPQVEWPIEKRAKWLRAAAQNFDLIYPDTTEDSIEIKVQRGSQK